jgi:hypothetical protein
LTKSLTPRRAVTCSASSTATPGTTRSRSRKKTRRDCVHHPVWLVLLHDHVLRVEERRRHIPTGLLQEVTQQERQSLRG